MLCFTRPQGEIGNHLIIRPFECHHIPTNPQKGANAMELHELIIKAHAQAHAAELAAHANCQNAAWNELALLRDMLNNQPELKAGGAPETPPLERHEP